MDKEISILKQHDAWKLIELPNGKENVGLKWVNKIKYRHDGSIQKYKAQLVAKG